MNKSFPYLVVLLIATIVFTSFASLVYHIGFWEHLQEKHEVNMTLAKPVNAAMLSYFENFNYQSGPLYKGLTQEESDHMLDVKIRINLCILFAFLSCFTSLFFLRNAKQKELSEIFIWASGFVFIIPLLFLFVPFEPLFSVFHQIFFAQGTYLFAWDSLLITVYPQEFFQDFAFALLKGMYTFAALFFITGFVLKKFK